MNQIQSIALSGRTVGGHLDYHRSVSGYIDEYTAEELHIETLAPQYQALVEKERAIVQRPTSQRYTTELAELDGRRDRAAGVVINLVKAHTTTLIEDKRVAALELKSVLDPYAGVSKQAYQKESQMIDGLLTALALPENEALVETLGLADEVQSLSDAQQAFAAMYERSREDATARMDLESVDTKELRGQVDDLYQQIVMYVNAYALTAPSEALQGFIDKVNGAKAWLHFGGFRVQPMEFAKIAIALAVARFMSEYSFSISRAGDLFRLAAIILVPFGIVILQNDTGSGIVLGSFLFVLFREGLNKWICIPIIFIATLFIVSFLISPTTLLLALITVFTLSEGMMNRRWRDCIRYAAALLLSSIVLYLVLDALLPGGFDYYKSLLIATLLSLFVVLWYAYRNNLRNIYVSVAIFFLSMMFLPTSDFIFSSVLQPHQQKRILNFLGLLDDNYNVNQSKIAIGSGGFFGKGYLEGTQIRYNFVPEKHTDFIFCTVGEETGFVGSIVVLSLLCMLILRLMRMGDRQQETFGRVYCYCVAAIILFHTFVNVGMTIGIVPVMGIPLPFVSYGGSSFMAFTIMVFIAFSLDASTRKGLPTYGGRA